MTSNILLEAIQAKPASTRIIIGQGELVNNFSNHTKKNNNGSKKVSIASPYVRAKVLNARSIPFLKSRNSCCSITGNWSKKSISTYMK
jgi:hypothetical protein